MSAWVGVVTCAVLGAIAGGLGWLLTRRLAARHKKASAMVSAALMAVAVTLGTQLVVPRVQQRLIWREVRDGGMVLYGNERVAAAYADAVVPIVQSAAFHERLRASRADGAAASAPAGIAGLDDASQGFGAQLSAAGLARLPADELTALFGVRRALADTSEELCAGLWTGAIQKEPFIAGLHRVSEADQRIWASVSARALSLEVHASGPPARIAGADANRATVALIQSLPADQRETLMTAFATPTLTPAEACRAFRTLTDGLKNLDPGARATLLRSIVGPQLVDR